MQFNYPLGGHDLFLLVSFYGFLSFDTNNSAFSLKNRYVFENGTVEDIIALFNDVLSTLSYDKYPVDNESVLYKYTF